MKKFTLFIPWLIVCIATVGTLFFTEILHSEPCTLCWYQRVVMFPLAIILGIAAFRGAYRIIIYVLPLSLIGLGIATYQVVMIHFFAKVPYCAACTLKVVGPHPITFPGLSMLAFLIISGLLIWIYCKHKKNKKL